MANEKRLIDANALITKIQGTASEVAKNAPYDPEWFTRLAARQFEILCLIDDMPTVDAVEVVHGRWIKVQEPLGCRDVDCVECSACHESWIIDEDYCFDDFGGWKYCPNCGTKMDGGVDDA